MSKNVQKIYSNQTGIFREVDEHEDLDLLQDYEVVVNALPKPSCPKCYGRGYVGRDIVRKELMMCRKCFRKITDFDHARSRVKKQLETIQAEQAKLKAETPGAPENALTFVSADGQLPVVKSPLAPSIGELY